MNESRHVCREDAGALLHGSVHLPYRYSQGVLPLPSMLAGARLECQSALQTLLWHVTSPVCTCRGHTGAVTPPTATSEPCRCPRTYALRAVGNGHPAHRYF